MRRLAIAALLLSLFAAGVPAALGQSCATPAPTYTPTPGYKATIQAISPGDLLVYYPLDETSGTVAEDHSGNNADGTYSGVTLNSTTFLTGDPAGSWDGVNDYVDFLTAFLISVFNGDEGTISGWTQVPSGVWTNGVTERVLVLQVDNTFTVRVTKGIANNILQLNYHGNTVNQSTSTTQWFNWSITWSLSGNAARRYYNGTQVSTTLTGFSAWAGTLTLALLGVSAIAGTNPLQGSIAQVAIWDVPLDATKIALLATVDPVLTIPPTSTLCPTYTPTPTPTYSPTYTPTPTNTPDIYHFWTVAPSGPTGTPLPDATGTPTPAPGIDVVFVADMSAGQVGIVFFLAAIFFSGLITWIVVLLRGRERKRTPRPVKQEDDKLG